MAEELDYLGYPTKSRRIHDNAWFYIEPKGLCVVIDNKPHGANTATISWRSVEAALKARKRATKARRLADRVLKKDKQARRS